MEGYKIMANDLCQKALAGVPIKASVVKEFFETADTVLAAANAVKSVFSSFHPDIDNDIEMKKDVVFEPESDSESEV